MKQIMILCDISDIVYYVDRNGIGTIIPLTCSAINRTEEGTKYYFEEMVGYFENKDFNNTLFTNYGAAYDAIEDYRATATIN